MARSNVDADEEEEEEEKTNSAEVVEALGSGGRYATRGSGEVNIGNRDVSRGRNHAHAHATSPRATIVSKSLQQ